MTRKDSVPLGHWEQLPFPARHGVSVGNAWDSGHSTDRMPTAAKAEQETVVE